MFGRQWIFKLCWPTSSGTYYRYKKWYAPTHTLSVDNVREHYTGKYCVSCLPLETKTNYNLRTCHYSIARLGRDTRSEWGLRFSHIWLRRYIFWDVTSCSLVNMYRCSRRTCCLWNVVTRLPEHMAMHPRRQLGLSRLRHYAEEKLASVSQTAQCHKE